ncbi:MAG TPA: serine hydrolase domain-containing protein, partial [Gemmatimonadaceae bacterium]|nr:serine hydrolase domain-containing protein [Gemmatimonadaceae bacterium]
GLADRERRIPSTVTTRFHVGGVTKALTALAVLDLVDRGRLELHEPVTRYLPALRGPVGAITIHQLLTHTDGLPELPDLTSGPSSLLAALQAARPAFETGQSYGSTNTGHALLALVVEQVAGRPFERYVREHQLAPAGMTRSFLRTEGVQLDDVAVGYADNARPTRPAPDETSARGSLGLVTTVGDLHRWFDAFIGGRLVSPRVVRTMLTPYLRTAKPFEQGYGWLLYDSTTARPFRSGPLPLVRRSGRAPGFEAEVVHDRNAGWIAIVLVNSDVLMRHRAIETVRMVMDRTGTDAKPPPLIVRR